MKNGFGKDKSEDKRELSEEDFICSCCYEVLLDPTTLSCGHTFCRFCLANWWSSSRKAECLQCRQPFYEFPSVNFTLRDTIERICPARIKERRKSQKSVSNYSSVLKAFEEHAERSRNDQNEQRANGNINCGSICIIISLAIAIVVLIAFGMKLTKTIFGVFNADLETKTLSRWTADDVSYWVGEQGIWAKGKYQKRFLQAGIDGNLLIRMTEADLLDPPINMNLALHRRVLMNAIQRMLIKKIKQLDLDFWHYKVKYRTKSIFILHGLRQFPRTTLVYLYLFDYYDVFLPFLHRTCKLEETMKFPTDQIRKMNTALTWQQLGSCIITLVAMPYYLIGLFATDYLEINYWVSRTVICFALMMTGCELTQIGWLIRRKGYKTLPRMVLYSAVVVICSSLILKILSPFVPNFIYNLVFSWMLFVAPFDAFKRLFKELKNLVSDPEQQREGDPEANRGWQFNFQVQRE